MVWSLASTITPMDARSARPPSSDGGGRLCYLGGNGFYWKVALSTERDGLIEIRRGEGGIRAWAAEPGEYYNQFDGEYASGRKGAGRSRYRPSPPAPNRR